MRVIAVLGVLFLLTAFLGGLVLAEGESDEVEVEATVETTFGVSFPSDLNLGEIAPGEEATAGDSIGINTNNPDLDVTINTSGDKLSDGVNTLNNSLEISFEDEDFNPIDDASHTSTGAGEIDFKFRQEVDENDPPGDYSTEVEFSVTPSY